MEPEKPSRLASRPKFNAWLSSPESYMANLKMNVQPRLDIFRDAVEAARPGDLFVIQPKIRTTECSLVP